MYDDRLHIIYKFDLNGKERVNKFKIIEMDDYLQVYVTSGERWSQTRLYKEDVNKLIKYLGNVTWLK